MVDLALRDCGWETIPLGTGLPFSTLKAAVAEHRPRLFWLSVTHITDVESFVAGYNDFRDSAPAEVGIAVGGQALTDEVRKRIRYASYCDKLKHLQSFAETLVG
jgi:hypothetical protein